VTWQRIDPRHLRQRDLHGVMVAYAEAGSRDAGHLLLTLDANGVASAFELTWERFPGGRESSAGWSRGHGLRVDELDTGQVGASFGPRFKPSPLVRYYALPPRADAAALVAYVECQHSVLPEAQYQAGIGVLRTAAEDDGLDA
jgi:hypothetical protein